MNKTERDAAVEKEAVLHITYNYPCVDTNDSEDLGLKSAINDYKAGSLSLSHLEFVVRRAVELARESQREVREIPGPYGGVRTLERQIQKPPDEILSILKSELGIKEGE